MKAYNYIFITVVIIGVLSVLIAKGIFVYRKENENSSSSMKESENLLKHTKGN